MLEATSLTKRYNGVTALDLLTLKVEPGEVFCLLGVSREGTSREIGPHETLSALRAIQRCTCSPHSSVPRDS